LTVVVHALAEQPSNGGNGANPAVPGAKAERPVSASKAVLGYYVGF